MPGKYWGTAHKGERKVCVHCGREFWTKQWNKIYCGECANPIALARAAWREKNQRKISEYRRRWREKIRAKWGAA